MGRSETPPGHGVMARLESAQVPAADGTRQLVQTLGLAKLMRRNVPTAPGRRARRNAMEPRGGWQRRRGGLRGGLLPGQVAAEGAQRKAPLRRGRSGWSRWKGFEGSPAICMWRGVWWVTPRPRLLQDAHARSAGGQRRSRGRGEGKRHSTDRRTWQRRDRRGWRSLAAARQRLGLRLELALLVLAIAIIALLAVAFLAVGLVALFAFGLGAQLASGLFALRFGSQEGRPHVLALAASVAPAVAAIPPRLVTPLLGATF